MTYAADKEQANEGTEGARGEYEEGLGSLLMRCLHLLPRNWWLASQRLYF
jgi:hypothetical protein